MNRVLGREDENYGERGSEFCLGKRKVDKDSESERHRDRMGKCKNLTRKKVWQVIKKDTGQVYAMKVLRKTDILEQNLVDHTRLERYLILTLPSPFCATFFSF